MSSIDDLATVPGVQAYLHDHPQFGAHTVERLSGGMANFTYRIHLLRVHAGRQTLALKYAPPAASGGEFPLDQKRQLAEVQALHLAARLSTTNVPAFLKIPVIHLHDEEKHVIIMDDAGEDCRTLKELLIEEGLPNTISAQIGTALGEFIYGVHTWNQNPDVDLTVFANNQVGKYYSADWTYGHVEDNIPTLSDPLLGISEANMTTIGKVVEKRQKAIHAASPSDPMTHGDLWPGNLVMVPRRGADGVVEGVEKLYVLDWEASRTGLPGLDLGQFCAELHILSEFYPARKRGSAYRERRGKGGDVELARVVASHIGTHAVVFTPRISSWSGREKTREVVTEGAEMLVLGKEGSELALKTSIPILYSSICQPSPDILACVPQEERQQTVLSLTRAISRSPVPLHHLFEHVRLKSAERVVQLYRRLRGRLEEPRWVKSFSLETWSVDADVVVNLVSLLSQLSRITLFVGPNFSPEHMEEMLKKPREPLKCIALRFRPYVQRATYYQFLKGAYFDTTLDALSRWPTANLASLFVVQDPLDAEIARKHNFAQPLVFFRLEPIHRLACSPYLRSLTSLRLRIPSRQVAPFIYSSSRSTPGIRLLDLSTCSIRSTDVEALVARFQQLMHLILDGCNTTRGDALLESEWAKVGKICALASVKAAKEREKKLKTWLEGHAARDTPGDQVDAATVPQGEVAAARRTRPGRRGLATATVSFRDAPTRSEAPAIRTNVAIPKVRIVPSPPTLRSLSTTTSVLHNDRHDAIRAQFEKGWDEGLAQLSAIRGRLYQSWKNGVRMMRITGDQGMEEGFEGLEDIGGEDAFYGQDESGNVWSMPVLCLAGTDADPGQHVGGCGHVAASCVWPDRI